VQKAMKLDGQVTTATPEKTQERPGWAADRQVDDAFSVCLRAVATAGDERRIQTKQPLLGRVCGLRIADCGLLYAPARVRLIPHHPTPRGSSCAILFKAALPYRYHRNPLSLDHISVNSHG
jgi:hypothetical protein